MQGDGRNTGRGVGTETGKVGRAQIREGPRIQARASRLARGDEEVPTFLSELIGNVEEGVSAEPEERGPA